MFEAAIETQDDCLDNHGNICLIWENVSKSYYVYIKGVRISILLSVKWFAIGVLTSDVMHHRRHHTDT